jgi:glycogen(starch) synthase
VGNGCDADPPRLQLLLDAFAGLAPRHERLHLLLPQPQAEHDAAQLAELIHARNLSERVHLHSPEEGTDRAGFLHACDAVILLSAGQVTPREVFEVWSAGKPVIGDRFSGIGTLVQDGETGLLFDPESSQAAARLSSHIEAVHQDENLRQKLAGNGEAEAQSHDWSQVQAKLEEIYQEAERHHKKARDLRLKAAA